MRLKIVHNLPPLGIHAVILNGVTDTPRDISFYALPKTCAGVIIYREEPSHTNGGVPEDAGGIVTPYSPHAAVLVLSSRPRPFSPLI